MHTRTWLVVSLLSLWGCKSPRSGGDTALTPSASTLTATDAPAASTSPSPAPAEAPSHGGSTTSASTSAAPAGSSLARAACAKYEIVTHVEGAEVSAPWVDAQRCVAADRDAWRVELDGYSATDAGVHACPKLVHIRANGEATARHLKHPLTVVGCRGQDCWATSCETFLLEYASSLAITHVHDWDGDGETEAAVEAGVSLSRGRVASRVIVVDDTGTALRHLPSTLSLTIADVDDIDGDSAPDFLLHFSSGIQTDDFGIVGADTLELAAHVLPGGNVSATDEHARRYAAKRCPEVKLDAISDEVSLLCAKLRGTPRDVAIQAFRANCKGDQLLGCSTEPGSTWDAFHPPFTL